MTITSRYQNVNNSEGVLNNAPFINIKLRNKNSKLINAIALIDSGADISVIPKDLANILGLNEKENTKGITQGIGGDVKVRRSYINVIVSGKNEKYNLFIPVLILQDYNQDIPILLGRNGFFENFHITFQQNKKKIKLKKVNQTFSP